MPCSKSSALIGNRSLAAIAPRITAFMMLPASRAARSMSNKIARLAICRAASRILSPS